MPAVLHPSAMTRISLIAIAAVLVACTGTQAASTAPSRSSAASRPAAIVIPDPKMGPHAIEEARHAATAPLLAPATTAVIPLRAGAHPGPLQTYAVTPPATPFHREVFGFAPYWSITHNAEWDYRLLSTVAYFGITIESNGYFNTTVSGWNQWNSQDLVNTINSAHAAGDRVVVVVKQFNHTTINNLVTSPANTQVAITNIIAAIDSKGLDGVNIDFEGGTEGFPNVQSGLVSFMSQLSTQVHAKWPTAEVSIDTYSGAASWDQGFFKIDSLAPVVDAMFIMAYDMSFEDIPGHSGPNAPMCADAQKCSVAFTDCTGLPAPCYVFNDTTSVTEYLTKAPASKVILGVPYYGYKWSTVSSVPNSAIQPQLPTAIADTYSNIVSELSCNLTSRVDGWDSTAQSPWVAWYSPHTNDPCGANLWTWREIYYDNPYSLGVKYDLVNRNNLRGAGMWALGYDSGVPDLWNVIAAKLTTVTVWDGQGGLTTTDPTVASTGPNHLDAFIRGTDNVLWHRSWDGTTWQPWESLGGILTSAPAAISWGPNRIDVFVRGTDNALWRRSWDGTAWSSWSSLGGVLSSAPDVASWSANHLDVFVRGTDNGLWSRRWDGTAWQPWTRLGGVLTSDPSAVSWGTGRIDVFVRGTDRAIWHLWWDGAAWRGWESLGGVLTSSPSVASCGVGKLDVFGVGLGGALYRKGWNGTSWSFWEPQGGLWSTGPSAVCEPTTTTIDVFEVATDRALWHTAVLSS
jgi:spore germination protein YaaH